MGFATEPAIEAVKKQNLWSRIDPREKGWDSILNILNNAESMNDFRRPPETVLDVSETSKPTMAHEMDDISQTSLYATLF